MTLLKAMWSIDNNIYITVCVSAGRQQECVCGVGLIYAEVRLTLTTTSARTATVTANSDSHTDVQRADQCFHWQPVEMMKNMLDQVFVGPVITKDFKGQQHQWKKKLLKFKFNIKAARERDVSDFLHCNSEWVGHSAQVYSLTLIWCLTASLEFHSHTERDCGNVSQED